MNSVKISSVLRQQPLICMAGARLPELSLWFARVSRPNRFVQAHQLKSGHFPRGTSLHFEDGCPL